jgi:hypothetical protein
MSLRLILEMRMKSLRVWRLRVSRLRAWDESQEVEFLGVGFEGAEVESIGEAA